MFADSFCRGWNSVRVRFWSIGYKKRLLVFIFLLFSLGVFLAWTLLFANLADLHITQKQEGNGSTIWDKWVRDNGLQSIGDIWDACGEFAFENQPFYLLTFVKMSVKEHIEKVVRFSVAKSEKRARLQNSTQLDSFYLNRHTFWISSTNSKVRTNITRFIYSTLEKNFTKCTNCGPQISKKVESAE